MGWVEMNEVILKRSYCNVCEWCVGGVCNDPLATPCKRNSQSSFFKNQSEGVQKIGVKKIGGKPKRMIRLRVYREDLI
jgi:hypothetical protein